ncbi:septation ring formation regulator EzrA [Jeotgalibacillus sp. S-D1]|uniref:septation ring formation regulator EzrA n=1 Tax=Jeotgalibacillus sp. S-D1 TaxID=2552189 RepID=UPI001404D7A8|nr:septation ring formation regulator EzrA [Jeotgalibacillus sp. S-D1]
MEYLIGSVILIVIIIAIALFWRKKEYKEVDQLEAIKLEIQHRPILEEMTKVKQLNMNGQTEELFEGWRKTWTQVADGKLAEVDSLLFDAEEYIDKFQFKKSKTLRDTIRIMLDEAEKDMNQILIELEELMGSDEKNKEEMETIQSDYKIARRELFTQRHTYGKAAEAIERKIEAIDPKLIQYNEMTENGNYLAARELVLLLADEIELIKRLLDELPEMYNETYYTMPSQLSELKEGFEEMKVAGFPLFHITLEKDAELIQSSIDQARTHVNRLEMQEAGILITAIHDQIDNLYDLLEKEVDARANVAEFAEPTGQWLYSQQDQNLSLKSETEFVRQGYKMDKEDLDVPREIEKKLLRIDKKYTVVKERLNAGQTAFSILWDELKIIREELEAIAPAQNEFKEQLQRLRQDEVNVRDLDQELKHMLKEQERKMRHANLPRYPEYILDQIDDAHDQLYLLEQSLSEKPLNLITIQQHASTSSVMVEAACQETEKMIQTAQAVEKVIQYGNRYRSKHEEVYIGLSEAELLFRKAQYQEALEKASEAIEMVEPGALKRIEELTGDAIQDRQYVKQ